jgi:phage nucleotide-binding protein
MDIKNTQKDYADVASIVICVYGQGGVGKTTFAATFPKPLLFDFENGAKYFKQRGIDIDVVRMEKWFSLEEKKELAEAVAPYETIVFDPIGEMMEKLIHSDHISGSKYRQPDGSLSMAGWGKVKDEFRAMIKWARDLNKHIVLVAHVDEKQDDDHLVKRPLIATKISDEIIAMVDIVGYLDMTTVDGEDKRVLRVEPTERIYAKDRTGTLDKFVKPEFSYIYEQIKSRQDVKVEKDADAQESEHSEEEEHIDDDIPVEVAREASPIKKSRKTKTA